MSRIRYILDANCNICGLPRPFSRQFRSVPSFGISSSAELGMPRNEHFLPRNNGTVPSLFRGIFSERYSVPNPNCISPNSGLIKKCFFYKTLTNNEITQNSKSGPKNSQSCVPLMLVSQCIA
jgi:hypothetical protein